MLKEGYYITETLNEPIPTNKHCLVVYLKETEKNNQDGKTQNVWIF